MQHTPHLLVAMSFTFVAPTPLSQCTLFLPTTSTCHTRRRHAVLPTSTTPRRHVMVAQPAAQPTSSTTPASTPPSSSPITGTTYDFSSPEFSTAVSGEWFGYEVAFSARTGQAQTIPERYVPDEFKNWDVEIKGFDMVTSTAVIDTGLLVRRTRALPSVGCEADAVVPEVVETILSSRGTEAIIAGGTADGSFSSGPTQLLSLSQRWEFTLMNPNDSVRSRVRLQFGRLDEGVGAIVAYLENWDLAFGNGEILPGCGGPNSSFADDAIMEKQLLAGEWNVSGMKWMTTDDGEELSAGDNVQYNVQRDAVFDGMLLPRGLTARVVTDDDGACVVEAGWMAGDDVRTVARRTYGDDGKLTSVEHVVERRVMTS